MFNFDKNNWQEYEFSDIADQISERIDPADTNADIYVGLEHIEPNSIHIKEFGTPSDVKGTKLKVYKGDMIFGKRRAYQRKAAIADFDGICSAHAMVLRAKQKVMIPELFPFFLHSDAFMNRAIDISEGSLSPTIKWKILAKQKFTIPPLSEQKKLADLLWAGDILLQKYYKLLSATNIFRQSYFKSSVLEKQKNGLLKDLYRLKNSRSEPPHDLDSYLGMEGVDSGRFFLTKIESSKDIKSSCSIFSPGDILYGKLRPNLDKAIIGDLNGICSTEFLVLKPHTNMTWFLCQYLHSKQFVFYSSSRGYGTKMPRVSEDIISRFRVHIPEKEKLEMINKKIEESYNFALDVKRQIQNQKILLKTIKNQMFS